MLYLVATPIGNLGDITLRALEVLRAADMIASEDTRKTGILLKHFGIQKPQMAFHEHNEDRAGERIVALLAEGKSVALVSDAGTPGISDPGYSIIQRVLAAGEEVSMAPGPAAVVMAAVLSGLPLHSLRIGASRLTRGDRGGAFSRSIRTRLTRSSSMRAPIVCRPFLRMPCWYMVTAGLQSCTS